MNLFILSLCVKQCAEAMFDKHLPKIILEAVQMLCTAKRILDPYNVDETLIYKISHKNHPVSIWIRKSYTNYMWTIRLVETMHEEWKWRFNHPPEKMHKSYVLAQYLKSCPPPMHAFPYQGLTKFAQAMPDQYKVAGNAVQSYRNYYQGKEKSHLVSWRKRGPPDWWTKPNDSCICF